MSPRVMCFVFALVLASSSNALEKEVALSLERATALAFERNPDLKAQAAELDAWRARLDGASRLLQRNPEISGAVGPRSNDSGGSSLDYGVELGQELEVAGQRGSRIDAATAGLRAAEARVKAQRVRLASDVREAFGRALASEQLLTLQEEGEHLSRQALEAVEARFRAGAASRIEVNAAKVELGRAVREKAQAVSRRALTVSELRLLVGLDPSHPVQLAGELSIPTEIDRPDVKAVVEHAMANRAELVAARGDLTAAQAERRLASREAFPSPRVGVSFEREESARILQGTLAFELPVVARNQSERGVTAARVRQAELALQALEARVQQEARLAVARHDAAHQAAQAYAGGIVQAMQENLGLVDEAYRAGKIDFFQLVLIRRETLEARRGYIEALEELNSAEAQLDRTLGSLP